MKSYRFYDPETGLFSSRTISSSAEVDIEANTPAGMTAIEGEFDPLSQRVDVETGLVVDHQPEKPSDDHEWDEFRRRWRLTPTALEAIAADNEARAEIQKQEGGSARAQRELLLELLGDESVRAKLSEKGVAALEKLQTVEDAIAAERPRISQKGDARGAT